MEVARHRRSMADQRAARADLPRKRSTVTIVDDDPEMRELLRDLLIDQGLHVREADSERLIEALEAEPPALVVVDKEMPGPSGLDLLSYIVRRYPAVPVMLITAFGGSEVEIEAKARGAAGYLEKPFRISKFLEEIARLVPA